MLHLNILLLNTLFLSPSPIIYYVCDICVYLYVYRHNKQMVFFALAMMWSYPSSPYKVEGKKTRVGKPLLDSINYGKCSLSPSSFHSYQEINFLSISNIISLIFLRCRISIITSSIFVLLVFQPTSWKK